MLYVTTRQNKDVFTASKACSDNSAPDNGFFVPFQIPNFDKSEIIAFTEKSFGQAVAEILNLFFSARINSKDVELLIGKNPFRISVLNNKVAVAELWHNPKFSYSYVENSLYRMLSQAECLCNSPTLWPRIAIRIATLFGVFGELSRFEWTGSNQSFDVAVPTGDFVLPMAVWYARAMGLPVETAIYCCEDNSPVWDLVSRGEVNTSMQNIPAGIEQLIYNTLGIDAVNQFLKAYEKRKVYALDAESHTLFCNRLFAAVVGNARVPTVINSVYRTNNYTITPSSAVALGGLQDYRASTGEGRFALLLSDDSPRLFADAISDAIGIPASTI